MAVSKQISKIKQEIVNFKRIIDSTLLWRNIYLESSDPSDLIKNGVEVYPKVISKKECSDIIGEIRKFESEESPPNDKHDNAVVDTKITQYYDIDKKLTDSRISDLGERFSKLLENSLDNRFVVKRSACVYQKDDIDISSTKRQSHIDSYVGTHKVFLYLTDVLKPGYGPYNYFVGSPRKYIFLKLVNQFLNPILSRQRGSMYNFFNSIIEPQICMHEKGTAILGNQTGIHKGHSPQDEGPREILMFYYSIVPKKKEATPISESE